MNIAPVSPAEQGKSKGPDEYYNLDKLPDVDVNDICRIVSEICDTPASLVCIVDANRNWLKSFGSSKKTEVPEGFPFRGNDSAIPGEVFIVPDLSKDKRFKDHIYVTGPHHVVYYAEITLVNCEGGELGTLCILDTQRRELGDKQTEALKNYAKQIACMLELSGKVTKLKQKQAELSMAYTDLAKMSHIASHDLKSPLNNIISITHLMKEEYGSKLDVEGAEYINYLNDAAYQLSDLISGLLSYSKYSRLVVEHKEHIDIAALMEEVNGLLNVPANAVITYPQVGGIYTSRVALKQILLQLVHNAIKYNDKTSIKVDVIFNENDTAYSIEVKDNGPGIAKEDHAKVFELFEKLHGNIKDGESMGVGLAIVKRLVEKLSGGIKVDAELGSGASFVFTIPKPSCP